MNFDATGKYGNSKLLFSLLKAKRILVRCKKRKISVAFSDIMLSTMAYEKKVN